MGINFLLKCLTRQNSILFPIIKHFFNNSFFIL